MTYKRHGIEYESIEDFYTEHNIDNAMIRKVRRVFTYMRHWTIKRWATSDLVKQSYGDFMLAKWRSELNDLKLQKAAHVIYSQYI